MRIKYFTKAQMVKIHIYPPGGVGRGGEEYGVRRSKLTKNRVDFQN